jgi:hypothetical protein
VVSFQLVPCRLPFEGDAIIAHWTREMIALALHANIGQRIDIDVRSENFLQSCVYEGESNQNPVLLTHVLTVTT